MCFDVLYSCFCMHLFEILKRVRHSNKNTSFASTSTKHNALDQCAASPLKEEKQNSTQQTAQEKLQISQ